MFIRVQKRNHVAYQSVLVNSQAKDCVECTDQSSGKSHKVAAWPPLGSSILMHSTSPKRLTGSQQFVGIHSVVTSHLFVVKVDTYNGDEPGYS